MNNGRLFKIFLVAFIFILGAIVIFLLLANAAVNSGFKKIYRDKEVEFQREVAAIRDEARRDMNARYVVSDTKFEDIVKKVEMEKNRLRDLQEKSKKKIK